MSLLAIKLDKKKLTKSQSTYNRLVKQIEKLQRTLQEEGAELHQGLQYYLSSVCPLKEEIVTLLPECIQILYSYYKAFPSKLSKKEQETLKELMQHLFKRLNNFMLPQEMSSEIIDIISDVEEVNFREEIKNVYDSLKKELIEDAAKHGVDIDLSNIDLSGSKEELMAQLQNAAFEALEKKEVDSTENSQEDIREEKKTKSQLKKEQQAREIEEFQKKGLSRIYKQLAKVLHPDLEPDPLIKAEKEELMKKLTIAYENQDLHTLLSLEITWMNRTASNGEESGFENTEEKLKCYNMILKDQVEELRAEIDCLWDHPRYFEMRSTLRENPECHASSFLKTLEEITEKFSDDIKLYSSTISDLKSGSNVKGMKKILKDFSSKPDFLKMVAALFS